MKNKIHELIIIGSGPAGLTAAIYAARANLHPLIIEGKEPGGQLMGTTAVENWPGEKNIMGPQLMLNMKEHAKHFGTEFLSESVAQVDFSHRPFMLRTDRDKELKAHAIIIATGATPNKLNCPGEDEYWGKGVSTCAVCDGAFYADKKVLIVGGGDTAMEDASFMKKFTKNITIVQISDALTASHAMQQRVINDPDINIIYNATVTQIHGDGQHVTGATITNQKTNETTKLDVDGVFIAIGLKPNTAVFEGQLAMGKWGYLDIKNHTRTSVEGVFAAGDVSDYRYKQAVTSAGSGCMAALDAERYLKSIGK
ncbi:MAG TPA: thioredoxin-disulfide reductase [Candidatus Dependentiae bacterium]|nr:thioredoxin-disulfide reductase [Candidatus Dependentiae bacterium]HRQ62578.1 thioredoxin-disulfide reductase [Candidatus Dependentiae bacterium]